jgi:hypothetical protein
MALFKDGNPTTSGVKLFINNSQKSLSQVQGLSVSRTMDTGFRIGRGGFDDFNQNFDGYFQEIVIWSSDYSSTNRSDIQTNINDFYSIY